eukprot:scaffold28259_cov107-Isochrysis_galbana.AAC.2
MTCRRTRPGNGGELLRAEFSPPPGRLRGDHAEELGRSMAHLSVGPSQVSQLLRLEHAQPCWQGSLGRDGLQEGWHAPCVPGHRKRPRQVGEGLRCAVGHAGRHLGSQRVEQCRRGNTGRRERPSHHGDGLRREPWQSRGRLGRYRNKQPGRVTRGRREGPDDVGEGLRREVGQLRYGLLGEGVEEIRLRPVGCRERPGRVGQPLRVQVASAEQRPCPHRFPQACVWRPGKTELGNGMRRGGQRSRPKPVHCNCGLLGQRREELRIALQAESVGTARNLAQPRPARREMDLVKGPAVLSMEFHDGICALRVRDALVELPRVEQFPATHGIRAERNGADRGSRFKPQHCDDRWPWDRESDCRDVMQREDARQQCPCHPRHPVRRGVAESPRAELWTPCPVKSIYVSNY